MTTSYNKPAVDVNIQPTTTTATGRLLTTAMTTTTTMSTTSTVSTASSSRSNIIDHIIAVYPLGAVGSGSCTKTRAAPACMDCVLHTGHGHSTRRPAQCPHVWTAPCMRSQGQPARRPAQCPHVWTASRMRSQGQPTVAHVAHWGALVVSDEVRRHELS